MDIVGLIDASFSEAVKALVMGTSARSLARARERAFVKSLINRLRNNFDDDGYRIFASLQRGNQSDFGTNQLLHDIVVCRIEEGATDARQPESFRYVAEALWQIEVDFSREWRPALYAINRLNCGGAGNKLLVASQLARSQDRLMNTLRKPGAACAGTLYLALVPHPADWDDDAGAPQVWRFTEGEWAEVR